ncbi:CAP domain-containing protein [Shouchella lonarensis]|uniref:Uncharacterized protein, YkwD family n=1 Tax=Shouchella lonarensis TaxID=1464122 RepID=A0A1G6GL17_9BACI|nr:CAP domain-containing protein [Shouchella lonarensis]SDB82624.1 uncharacterized protein, YkwD family [Shouchella lonarensis]
MKKLLIAGIAAATLAGFSSTNMAEAKAGVYVSVDGPYVYKVKKGNSWNNCYSLGSMLRDMKVTYKRLDRGTMNLQALLEELTAGEWSKYLTVTPTQHKPEQKEQSPTEEKAPEKKEEKEPSTTPEPKQEEKAPKEEVPVETKEPEKKEEVPTETKTPEQEVETPAPEEVKEDKKEEVETPSELTQEEQQMADLVNEARTQAGLAPLKVNIDLTKVARVKSQDMITGNYFSHNSPTYGSPFDMMSSFGIQYRSAAENIAGNQTVEAAHRALMNSSGHYANIMGDFTEVGIGIVDGGPYGKMFTQMFKK